MDVDLALICMRISRVYILFDVRVCVMGILIGFRSPVTCDQITFKVLPCLLEF